MGDMNLRKEALFFINLLCGAFFSGDIEDVPASMNSNVVWIGDGLTDRVAYGRDEVLELFQTGSQSGRLVGSRGHAESLREDTAYAWGSLQVQSVANEITVTKTLTYSAFCHWDGIQMKLDLFHLSSSYADNGLSANILTLEKKYGKKRGSSSRRTRSFEIMKAAIVWRWNLQTT
jgi:hypothetical protein